jgi:hypothetical protein
MYTACASKDQNLSSPSASYQAGLQAALAASPADWPAYGEAEQAAVGALKRLFSEYTPEALEKNVPRVYTAEPFFRDGFREITDLETLTRYFMHSAASLSSCTFEFQPHASLNGNVYLPWTMTFRLKRDKETDFSEVIGMTHLRFNAEGQVIFHQDYWDPTDAVWRRIPLAGWLIKKVRARL